MKTSLQLKIGQQLSMTPQLQQAIRLLQLSTVELRQEIQEALEVNPLLEEEEQNPQADLDADAKNNKQTQETTADSIDTSTALNQKDMPNELPVDTTWDEMYTANTGNTGISIEHELPVYQGETTQTLHDYLIWQVELTPFTPIDRIIALAIIEAIDEQGFLSVSTTDILESMGNSELDLDEVAAVLKRIQQFEPIGIAARDLKECLLIQLEKYPIDTPWLKDAQLILEQHLDLLGNRDYRQLSKITKLKENQLKQVMLLIQELNPRPGNYITSNNTQYVIPDVSVFKAHGKWLATINPESIPRIKINEKYAALSKGSGIKNSADAQFIRSNLQEAKWLIKSLESRNETLLKVTRCILDKQKDFFEYGEEAMKPLVLNDVALEIEMHESTISRVTTQKYMHTPRGIFELKYFFSSHVNTSCGGECSSTAIRAIIKKLVAAENGAKPLSDNKIATILAEQGIKVARRTIAKYRESLGIAPSNQRKSLL